MSVNDTLFMMLKLARWPPTYEMAVPLAATENALIIDYVYVAFCHIVTWMLPGTNFFQFRSIFLLTFGSKYTRKCL